MHISILIKWPVSGSKHSAFGLDVFCVQMGFPPPDPPLFSAGTLLKSRGNSTSCSTLPPVLSLSLSPPSPRSDPPLDFQLYNITRLASLVGIHEAEWVEHGLCLLLSRVRLIFSHEYLPHLVTFLVIAAAAFLFHHPGLIAGKTGNLSSTPVTMATEPASLTWSEAGVSILRLPLGELCLPFSFSLWKKQKHFYWKNTCCVSIYFNDYLTTHFCSQTDASIELCSFRSFITGNKIYAQSKCDTALRPLWTESSFLTGLLLPGDLS